LRLPRRCAQGGRAFALPSRRAWADHLRRGVARPLRCEWRWLQLRNALADLGVIIGEVEHAKARRRKNCNAIIGRQRRQMTQRRRFGVEQICKFQMNIIKHIGDELLGVISPGFRSLDVQFPRVRLQSVRRLSGPEEPGSGHGRLQSTGWSEVFRQQRSRSSPGEGFLWRGAASLEPPRAPEPD
jgi:hypothetical protein